MRGGLAVLDLQGYCIEVWPYPCLTPSLSDPMRVQKSDLLFLSTTAFPGASSSWTTSAQLGPSRAGSVCAPGAGHHGLSALLQAYGASEGAIREAGGREPAGQQWWRGSTQQSLQGNWLLALGRGRERGWGAPCSGWASLGTGDSGLLFHVWGDFFPSELQH